MIHETPWTRPTDQPGILVKQFTWHGQAIAARTDEPLDLCYFQGCRINDAQADILTLVDAETAKARAQLEGRIRELAAGWAYLPKYDRVWMIASAVTEYIADLPHELQANLEALRDVVAKANAEYEQRWSAAERLGAEQGHAFGWRIPVEPAPVTP